MEKNMDEQIPTFDVTMNVLGLNGMYINADDTKFCVDCTVEQVTEHIGAKMAQYKEIGYIPLPHNGSIRCVNINSYQRIDFDMVEHKGE